MGRLVMTRPEHFFVGDRAHAPKPYHYRECGLDNIYLLNGFYLEEHDGEEYVSIENVEGLWKAIGLSLVTCRKVFSPKEIRFLRQQMHLTQLELAALLRVEDQTVARWEKGKVKLPGPADVALRALFLGSEIAQPQGGEILERWLEIIAQLVAQDQPLEDGLLFDKKPHAWEFQRKRAA
jgi:putative transcriptional regulator